MKNENLILAAVALGAVFVVYKMTSKAKPQAQAQGGKAQTLNGGGSITTEIVNTAQPGQTGAGWKYYSDGTAISPDGAYYQNGNWIYGGGIMGIMA